MGLKVIITLNPATGQIISTAVKSLFRFLLIFRFTFTFSMQQIRPSIRIFNHFVVFHASPLLLFPIAGGMEFHCCKRSTDIFLLLFIKFNNDYFTLIHVLHIYAPNFDDNGAVGIQSVSVSGVFIRFRPCYRWNAH